MCTRTRRHARFRIAFVEFVQYEDHRYQTRRRQQSIQSGLLARPKRRCDDRIQLLFLIRTTTSRMFGLIIPCRPRKRQGNNSGSKSRNNVTIYRKPKSQRLKHPRNHKQTEPMKLINIAISILVIGYFMLVSCSSDEGGESGNGPQATGQKLERQLLDTHWKLAKEIKVEDGSEKLLYNPYV